MKLEDGRRGETRVFFPLSLLQAAFPAIAVFSLWSHSSDTLCLPQCSCWAAPAPQLHSIISSPCPSTVQVVVVSCCT